MGVMSKRAVCLFGLLLAAVWFCCGCTEQGNANTADPSGQTNNTPAALAPESLSGKSYTFTVTSNQGFLEPFNSGYTIDFNSETSYTLHPAGQNGQATPDRQGNYTYDPRMGIVHFAETAPQSGRTIDAALTYTSPTAGTAHLTGRNGESQDVVFYQSAP